MPGKITSKAGTKISAQIGGFYEYLPEGYSPRKQYPTFILVHGAGETGPGSAATLPRVLNNLPARLARDGKFPVEAIVIIPQTTSAVSDATTIALVDYVTANYPVKSGKVITQGLSLGGNFPMKAAILRPDKTAAAIPMSAAYDITAENAGKVSAAKIPSWWFHGTSDGTISIGKTRSNVKKLEAAGAEVQVTYFEGVGHDSWSPATTFRNGKGQTWIEWAADLVNGAELPEIPETPEPDTYEINISPILNLKTTQRITGKGGNVISAIFGPQSLSPASPATNTASFSGPRYAAFTANKKPAQLILSDLTPGRTYDLQLWASRTANPDESTLFNGKAAVKSFNNAAPVSLSQQADADGSIRVEVAPGKLYGYLSRVIITERS